MAEKKGPVTTQTLANPVPQVPALGTPAGAPITPEFPVGTPKHLEAPVPGMHERVKEKPVAPAGPLTHYRVIVRHAPASRYKNLVVEATDEAGAWEAFQAEVRRLLSGEGENGKRILAAFHTWLSQQPPHRIPPDVSITTEESHQKLRQDLRDKKPRPA